MVKEVNPKDDENTRVVFEIKSEYCLGFTISGDAFYLIDDNKVVNKLVENKETKLL